MIRELHVTFEEVSVALQNSKKEKQIRQTEKSNCDVELLLLLAVLPVQLSHLALRLLRSFSHAPDAVVRPLNLLTLSRHLTQNSRRCFIGLIVGLATVFESFGLVRSVVDRWTVATLLVGRREGAARRHGWSLHSCSPEVTVKSVRVWIERDSSPSRADLFVYSLAIKAGVDDSIVVVGLFFMVVEHCWQPGPSPFLCSATSTAKGATMRGAVRPSPAIVDLTASSRTPLSLTTVST